LAPLSSIGGAALLGLGAAVAGVSIEAIHFADTEGIIVGTLATIT